MRHSVLLFILALSLLSCGKDNATMAPGYDTKIRSILYSADTMGTPRDAFLYGKPFVLVFKLINSTGTDQPYTWTGPKSEIIIRKGDSILARQYANTAWPQVILHDTLKNGAVFINTWTAPHCLDSTLLSVGAYIIDVLSHIRFDNAEVENVQCDTIMIESGVITLKPNIYLYPETACSIAVNIHFPHDGSVIKSEPNYGAGWNVFVEPDGKINQQYDYLFYEALNPDVYQYQFGWNVSRDTLASFFTSVFTQSGFNQNEIADFIDYWIPLLNDSKYYTIFPQWNADIAKAIELSLTPAPDVLLRVFFVIKKSETEICSLKKPVIPQCTRYGYVSTEWGVVLK